MSRRKDIQESAVVAECAHCRGGIYAGNEVMRIKESGEYVHNGYGFSCASDYAMERVYDAEGAIDVI